MRELFRRLFACQGTSVAIFWGPPSTSRPPAIPWFAYLIATPLHSRTHMHGHTLFAPAASKRVSTAEKLLLRDLASSPLAAQHH